MIRKLLLQLSWHTFVKQHSHNLEPEGYPSFFPRPSLHALGLLRENHPETRLAYRLLQCRREEFGQAPECQQTQAFRQESLSSVEPESLQPLILPPLDHSKALCRATGRRLTTAFSCGARSAFKLKEIGYLRTMLSRRQLQGFVSWRV